MSLPVLRGLSALTPLDPSEYREIVRRALHEDVGTGDLTTDAIVEPAQRARGVLVAKAACVVAGLPVAVETFHLLDPSTTAIARRQEGERCGRGDTIAEIVGSSRALLTGERTALNFLQRLCGIATLARQFVDAAGGGIIVLDTRKTTPTLRVLERYAVAVGGATNHRRGLYDAILIKDNHVRLAGSVSAAIGRARARHPGQAIEVEVQTLVQADEALAGGADVVMADNLSLDDVREVVRRAAGRARVEVSGGVTIDRVSELAASGADYLSAGALTHSAPAADISFEIEPI